MAYSLCGRQKIPSWRHAKSGFGAFGTTEAASDYVLVWKNPCCEKLVSWQWDRYSMDTKRTRQGSNLPNAAILDARQPKGMGAQKERPGFWALLKQYLLLPWMDTEIGDTIPGQQWHLFLPTLSTQFDHKGVSLWSQSGFEPEAQQWKFLCTF